MFGIFKKKKKYELVDEDDMLLDYMLLDMMEEADKLQELEQELEEFESMDEMDWF